MTQILGSISIILIIVIIAAVMIAVCGGLRFPKPDPAPQPKPKPRPASNQQRQQPRQDRAYNRQQPRQKRVYDQPRQQYRSRDPEPDYDGYESENMTAVRKKQYNGALTDDPTGRAPQQLAWILELIDDNDRVISRYDVPDCSSGNTTLGRSSKNDIHISGYGDMSREHLIFSQDRKGVYFEASELCGSTISVNGQLIFDGQRDTDTGFSKTYLRDGMILTLGSARLRVVYE